MVGGEEALPCPDGNGPLCWAVTDGGSGLVSRVRFVVAAEDAVNI